MSADRTDADLLIDHVDPAEAERGKGQTIVSLSTPPHHDQPPLEGSLEAALKHPPPNPPLVRLNRQAVSLPFPACKAFCRIGCGVSCGTIASTPPPSQVCSGTSLAVGREACGGMLRQRGAGKGSGRGLVLIPIAAPHL